MTTIIDFTSAFHVELHYHVLRHLRLKGDAASIFDGGCKKRPWAGPLLEAYQRSGGRLLVQVLPLLVDDLSGLIHELETPRRRLLNDQAGKKLGARMIDALMYEQEAQKLTWVETAEARHAAITSATAQLGETLASLREELYARSAQEAGRLRVFHAPSLGRHGRGVGPAKNRALAVDVRPPLERVLMQIFHEETHVVSDPPVRAAWQGVSQDTGGEGRGRDLHTAVEEAAFALGRDVIDRARPGLMPAYRAWCAEFGPRWALD